jgi:hypothetical protein
VNLFYIAQCCESLLAAMDTGFLNLTDPGQTPYLSLKCASESRIYLCKIMGVL